MRNKTARNFMMTALHCSTATIILFSSFAALTQTTTPPARTAPVKLGAVNMSPLPLNHVYWHFFIYQEHLEKVAAEHEKQGKDGSWLRDHFEKALGFSEGDFNIVRATALFVAQETKKLNQLEKSIIDSDRAAMKANPLPPGVPPPGIPRLSLITRDREALLNTQIDLMNNALGPVKAQTLRAYLMQTVQNGVNPPAATPAAKAAEVRK